MKKKTITDIGVSGKKVFVRCDFNVPADSEGNITDENRIVQTIPTLQYLLKHDAALILCSHMGRPKNGYEEKYSLKPVAARLSELINTHVGLAKNLDDAMEMAKTLKPGEVMMLENIRFEKGETKNDPGLAKKLASMADVFVSDAFGTCHRAHSSTAGIADFLPAVAGMLVMNELEVMGAALEQPKRPFLLILGGAKVSDKIGVIDNLLDKADDIIIAGGMAYTFIKASGGAIGQSLLEGEQLDYCSGLIKKAGGKLHFPIDVAVADRFAADAEKQILPIGEIPEDMMGMDIGPKSLESFSAIIKKAGTVVWNGPVGVFEFPAFAEGTKALARAVADSGAVSIIGGGDTAAAVKEYGDKITHISTGGGATLDYLAGYEMPGIDCLLDA